MKKCIIPLLLCALLTGCGQAAGGSGADGAQDAVSLTDASSVVYTSFQEVLDEAAFYVKATAISAQDIGTGVIEYRFSLEEDYAGNLETTDDGEFCVYDEAEGVYTVGSTYYLTLTAKTTAKYRSIGVILYEAVSAEQILLEEDGMVCIEESAGTNVVDAGVSADAASDPSPVEASDIFEAALAQYVEENTEEIAERAEEAIPDTSAGSLEQAMEQADAIWQITIEDGYAANTYFSVCTYRVDQVIKGDASYAAQTFSETIPTQWYTEDGTYLLLLCEVQRESYAELSVVFDDYWLLPLDSAGAQTSLAAYS